MSPRVGIIRPDRNEILIPFRSDFFHSARSLWHAIYPILSDLVHRAFRCNRMQNPKQISVTHKRRERTIGFQQLRINFPERVTWNSGDFVWPVSSIGYWYIIPDRVRVWHVIFRKKLSLFRRVRKIVEMVNGDSVVVGDLILPIYARRTTKNRSRSTQMKAVCSRVTRIILSFRTYRWKGRCSNASGFKRASTPRLHPRLRRIIIM